MLGELSPVLMAAEQTAAFDEALAIAPPFNPSSLDVLPENALPPPAYLLVEDTLAVDENDLRTSRQFSNGAYWPYSSWEVIL